MPHGGIITVSKCHQLEVVNSQKKTLRPIPASISKIQFEFRAHKSMAARSAVHGGAEEASTRSLQEMQNPELHFSPGGSQPVFFFFSRSPDDLYAHESLKSAKIDQWFSKCLSRISSISITGNVL